MAIDLNELATALGQIVLRFRLRRRTAADWTSSNEVLLSAEAGWETDTRKMKLGDGVTTWNNLAYWPDEGAKALASKNAGPGVDIQLYQPTIGGDPGNSASDPYFSNVSLLLHFEGQENGTNFDDTGPLGLPVGQAQFANKNIVTSQVVSKFGIASGHWSSGGIAGLSTPYNPAFDFGAAPWTIECWAWHANYQSNFNGSDCLFGSFHTGDPLVGMWCSMSYQPTNSVIQIYLYNSLGTSMGFKSFTPRAGSSVVTPIQTWHHIAVVRDGHIVRVFVDGIEWVVTNTTAGWDIGTTALYGGTDPFTIGYGRAPTATGGDWAGYIDEFRVTKGVARYTNDFTPPTAAFPSLGTPLQNDGDPYILISNSGVRSMRAGANVAIDNTDPHNPIISATGGGGGGGGGGGPDDRPSTPNAMDDEFDGTTLDTSKWSWTQQNSATATVSKSHLLMMGEPAGANSANVLDQALPTGDCAFVVKASGVVRTGNNFAACITLRESATNMLFGVGFFGSNPLVIGSNGSVSGGYVGLLFSGASGWAGISVTSTCYFKLQITGTTVTVSVSSDGAMWVLVFTGSLGAFFTVAPNRIGFSTRSSDSTNAAGMSVDYFRRIS